MQGGNLHNVKDIFMWKPFQKKIREAESLRTNNIQYIHKWHPIGPDNPFNKKILDIRGFTQTTLALTKDREVAVLFDHLRQSLGEELINTAMDNSELVIANLVYPHNGAKLAGAICKAECMEDKWDLYGWDDVIYFTRSWTGELVYKAFVKIAGTTLTIYKIEYNSNDSTKDRSLVINNVHFLVKTLALGAIHPHKVPMTLTTDDAIARYSFSLFGRNCWYATFNDITDTVVKLRKEE
jgi:hypothetical protein